MPSAAHGRLKQYMGRFQLAGEDKPTLREVNGGKLCVNGFGKQPSGYYISGNISLDECSHIAHDQPVPLGFRWGRTGFDYEVYTSYAAKSSQAEDESVDLARLFPGSEDFTCTIYIGADAIGQHFAFKS